MSFRFFDLGVCIEGFEVCIFSFARRFCEGFGGGGVILCWVAVLMYDSFMAFFIFMLGCYFDVKGDVF